MTSSPPPIPLETVIIKSKKVSKLFILDKELTTIAIDPHWQTADVDVNNNY